jgi:hypothetical protein
MQRSKLLEFNMLLGPSVHRVARRFSLHHSDPQKAIRVYLNILAVCAVHFYLTCMDVDSDREASQSWDPLAQILMDVADLTILGVGRLECCPIVAGTEIVQVSPDVQFDRVGYVVVEFDADLNKATLLGFAPTAEQGEIHVYQLRSLDDLMIHLQQLMDRKPDVTLSQWLQNTFETGWQAIDSLIAGHRLKELAYRSDTFISETVIKRAKLLNFGVQLGHQSVVLLIGVMPTAEQTFQILVQVHPPAEASHLPSNLNLVQFNEAGEVLQEVISRSQDNFIQLKRTYASIGECFKIQLTLNGISIQESFVI